jgi:hypothetical protein
MPEHDHEPLPGLPGMLPRGECILWSGRPDWRHLAGTAFFVNVLAIYFALLILARVTFDLLGGAPLGVALAGSINVAVLGVLALGLLTLLAWLNARVTRYTITDRRIVIRGGVAMSVSVNLPFERIVTASHRQRSGGFGDLPVQLDSETRPSWIILWPHVRPWRFASVQPMLRSVPNSAEVARLLADALVEFNGRGEGAGIPVRVQQDPVRKDRVLRPATPGLGAGAPSPG